MRAVGPRRSGDAGRRLGAVLAPAAFSTPPDWNNGCGSRTRDARARQRPMTSPWPSCSTRSTAARATSTRRSRRAVPYSARIPLSFEGTPLAVPRDRRRGQHLARRDHEHHAQPGCRGRCHAIRLQSATVRSAGDELSSARGGAGDGDDRHDRDAAPPAPPNVTLTAPLRRVRCGSPWRPRRSSNHHRRSTRRPGGDVGDAGHDAAGGVRRRRDQACALQAPRGAPSVTCWSSTRRRTPRRSRSRASPNRLRPRPRRT